MDTTSTSDLDDIPESYSDTDEGDLLHAMDCMRMYKDRVGCGADSYWRHIHKPHVKQFMKDRPLPTIRKGYFVELIRLVERRGMDRALEVWVNRMEQREENM